jgi:hypothetical protein
MDTSAATLLPSTGYLDTVLNLIDDYPLLSSHTTWARTKIVATVGPACSCFA